MDEKTFLLLLIDAVKCGNHIDRNMIVEALKHSRIEMVKSSNFSTKAHYCWEDINIISAPSAFDTIKQHIVYLTDIMHNIYPNNSEYTYELQSIYCKIGTVNLKERVNQEVIFEDIEERVITEINSAKYLIWIAMAWFTNPKIYDALVCKQKQGINIQLIIDDNDINSTVEFNLDQFETYRLSIESNYINTMHNKFCIIDLEKVMHGTFNWTKRAIYNKETCEFLNGDIVKDFADEFMKLKRQAVKYYDEKREFFAKSLF